jgi:hypothetical protein
LCSLPTLESMIRLKFIRVSRFSVWLHVAVVERHAIEAIVHDPCLPFRSKSLLQLVFENVVFLDVIGVVGLCWLNVSNVSRV